MPDVDHTWDVPVWTLQIVNLNNSVGSTERCQGGFISPAIDDDSTGTDLEMSPELTSVDILDYTLTNHINFEVREAGQAFCRTLHVITWKCDARIL